MSDSVIPRSVRRNHWMNHVAVHARMRPDATAFKHLGAVTTWSEFHDRVQSLAAALQRRGVGFGDRVMLLTLNSTEVLEAVFAVNTLGAMAVPINIRLTPPEIAFIIDDADADVIIADALLAPLIGATQQITSRLKRIIILGDASPDSDHESSNELIAEPLDGFEAPDVAESTPALIMYTSGTTGRPKGAMLDHLNLFSQATSMVRINGDHPDDVAFVTAPFFHIAGLGSIATSFLLGIPSIIHPLGAFNALDTIKAWEAERATVVFNVPTQWQAIVAEPYVKEADLALRIISWGAAPASETLLRQMTECFPNAFGPAGDLREYEVDDVFREVVFARRDEDFLAGDAVAAVPLWFGLGAQQAEIGAAMGLCKVHCAGPHAACEFRQVEGLLLFRAMGADGGVGTMGEALIHVEGHVCRYLHLADRGRDHVGHALASVLRVAVERWPAAPAHELEGLAKARGRAHDAVLKHAALAIAHCVEGGQHVASDATGFLEDRSRGVGIELRTARCRALRDAEHVMEEEGHVAERGHVVCHRIRLHDPEGRSGARPLEVFAFEDLFTPGELLAELGDRSIELTALGLHRLEAFEAEGIGAAELGFLLVADVVKIEQLADLLEAEAEALALQDQFQPRPAAPCIEAAGAYPARCDEFLCFVKPEGAGSHAEFGAHFANGQKGVAHAFFRHFAPAQGAG